MQASLNLAMYKEARGKFWLKDWRSLMMLSMGYNPAAFTPDQQT